MENGKEFIARILKERFEDIQIVPSFSSVKNSKLSPIIVFFNKNRVPTLGFIMNPKTKQKVLVEIKTMWSFQIDVYNNKSTSTIVEEVKSLLLENRIQIDNISDVENDPSGLNRTIINCFFNIDNLNKIIF